MKKTSVRLYTFALVEAIYLLSAIIFIVYQAIQ